MRAWIAAMLAAYRLPLIGLIALQLGCGILVAIQPRYIQQLVNLAVQGGGQELWQRGLVLLAWISAIYVSISLLQVLGGAIGSRFSFGLLRHIQCAFFEKTSRLPLQFFQHQPAGELFTKFNTDVGLAQRFFAEFLPAASRESITALAVMIVLWHYSPPSLALAAAGIALATAALATGFQGIMNRHTRRQRACWSAINQLFDETVQGIDTLKVLAAEAGQEQLLRCHSDGLWRLSIRSATLLAVLGPMADLLLKLGGLGLTVLAYYRMSQGAIGLESFLLFLFYASLLQMSVAQLCSAISGLPAQWTALHELAGFFAEPLESDAAPTDQSLPAGPSAIELRDLSFGFNHERMLYDHARLTIAPRSVTVVQGVSGAGKSTLINLLLRFYLPLAGRILIGGIDIQRVARAELRRKIGVVTQHHFIFHDTLRANLLIAQPEASAGLLLQCIEKAQLAEFVARLPEGLDTVLDPRGQGISAGEKQRISIARMLLRESPILVLDEPWSNLDEMARTLLADVINRCKANATVLILTHKLPAALQVDRISRLDEKSGRFCALTP